MFSNTNNRINIFFIAVLFFSGLVTYRLFILSVVKHSLYSRTAQAQSENISDVLARGNIYMKESGPDLFLAATNKKFPLAYIVPSEIKEEDRESAVKNLVRILDLEEEGLRNRINSNADGIKIVARRITNDQVAEIKLLGTKGAGISYEIDRLYPAGDMAANALGFLGYDANGIKAGQYGIEEYYDGYLFGKEEGVGGLLSGFDISDMLNSIKSLFDYDEAKSEILAETENNIDKPLDIVLTIDKNIQALVENKLEEVLDKWNAEKGTIIIQDPQTGKILAMADRPTFNPNNYGDFTPRLFLNGGIQEVYEPGSSFKLITMAAGLDLAKITPESTYEDKGVVEIAGYPIRNFDKKAHGINTMTQVLEKSLNTGTMFVENLLGDDNFLDYVINLGFGQRTGIDLPGEVGGDITNLYSGRKINYLTASFGQGIAVTPIQLINAYSTIANGGKLMRPYIVEKIMGGGEDIVKKPEIISIPISDRTAVKLQAMLTSVVDKGFDKARISGYDVAGKTGTAQIPDGKGGYSEDNYIHNFIGFAPSYNAKFVILIKIDKPQGINFASDSLSPVFKEITTYLLNYYKIPPTR